MNNTRVDSAEQRRNPWFKFYSSNWSSDKGLRASSLAARGLWIEMLCIMDESPDRGFLMVGNSKVSKSELARITGATVEEIRLLLEELADRGVYSRDNIGRIFSRKMVRDERKSRTNSENAKSTGGTDNKEEKSGRYSETAANTPAKPSRAGDRDLEARSQSQRKTPQTPLPLEPPGFDLFWSEYPRKVGKDAARKAYSLALGKGATPSLLAARATAFADQCDEKRTEEKFIPHASTWLNAGRYADGEDQELGIFEDPKLIEQRRALEFWKRWGCAVDKWDRLAWGHFMPPSPTCQFNRALLREFGIACAPYDGPPSPLIGE